VSTSRFTVEHRPAGLPGSYAPLDSGLLVPQAYVPNVPLANIPPAETYWPIVIVKSADQTSTVDTTYVDESELQFSVTTDSIWQFDWMLINSPDGEEDMKLRIVAPITLGWFRYVGSDNTANSDVSASFGVRLESVANSGDVLFGGGSSTINRMIFIQAMMQFSGSGTVKFQFASNEVQQSNEPIIRAGSRLRARQLL
jgi:hypothetical protein